MHIIINTEPLTEALKAAEAVSEVRSSMTILSHLALETSSGGLGIKATDLEVGLETTIPAEVKAPGQAALPAKTLLKAVSGSPADRVILKIDKDKPSRVQVWAKPAKYQLPFVPADEFPSLPGRETTGPADSTELELAARDLIEILAIPFPAAATDEGRYNLAGVCWEHKDGALHSVGTDGHWLSTLAREGGPEIPRIMIIPRKLITEALRLLRRLEPKEMVPVTIGPTWIMFRAGEITLAGRTLEAVYPQWETVIAPEDAPIKLTLNRPALVEAINRLAIVQDKDHLRIDLDKVEAGLELTWESHAGTAKERLPVLDSTGAEDLRLGLNYKYLAPALAVLQSEEITLRMTEPNRPVGISGPADEGVRVSIMPMMPMGRD